MAGWKMNRTQRRFSSEHHLQTGIFPATFDDYRRISPRSLEQYKIFRSVALGRGYTHTHIYIYTHICIHIIYILYIVFSHLANFCQFLLMVRLPLLSNSFFFMVKVPVRKNNSMWLVGCEILHHRKDGRNHLKPKENHGMFTTFFSHR